MTSNIRKMICILIGLGSIVLCILFWYQGGFMTVSESYKVEEIPIHNTLYPLGPGDNVRQGFQARGEILTGIDVLLVNTSTESTGDLVVQILDMWGEVIGEGGLSLAEIEPGTFVTVPLRVEMNREQNEEFQVCIFSENTGIIPGIVLVADKDDFEDNTFCYYNDDLVGDQGLIVGYDYGHEKFVGYKYQEKSIIWITVAKILTILLIGAALIYFVLTFQVAQIKNIVMDRQIFYQLTVISFLVGIFFFTAIFNKMTTDTSIPFWAYGALLFPVVLYLWTAFLFVDSIDRRKGEKCPKIDIYIWAIVFVCFAARIPLFTQLQRWDGGVYYAGLHAASVNFDFSFESIWNNFRLAAHPTFSFVFFMLIGEFLFPAKTTGALIVVLLMTTIALVFIYKMLCGYWCQLPKLPAMVFTMVISFIPLFWGTSSYINVDYTLLPFFIYLMYADYREQKIMMMFWTIALLLNKETGWIIVAGYYAVYVLKLWIRLKGDKLSQKIAGMCKDGIMRVILVGLLAACAYISRQGGLTGWRGVGTTSGIFASGEAIAEKGVGVDALGIYPAYIVCRLAQIFILNFMWIPTLIILVSVIYCVVKRRNEWKEIHNISGMTGALVMFILFSIIYITEALPRYLIFSTVILWLIALVVLYYVWGAILSRTKTMGICAFFVLLLMIQNFFYIDPFSNVVFNNLDSGKGRILSTNMNATYYGDTLVNNYRYSYLDKLLDKMLLEADYNKDKQIVLWTGNDQSYIGSMYFLPIGWDSNKKRRVIMDEKTMLQQTEIIPLNMIPMERVQNGEVLNGETILYFLPYYERNEEEYLSSLREYYQISERKEVSNWGGTLSYYILTQ